MITADTITDEQIREYTREHWRDPWPWGNGHAIVGDGCICALSSSHAELRRHNRARFADLINARSPAIARGAER